LRTLSAAPFGNALIIKTIGRNFPAMTCMQVAARVEARAKNRRV
jgi:hypothetical protein